MALSVDRSNHPAWEAVYNRPTISPYLSALLNPDLSMSRIPLPDDTAAVICTRHFLETPDMQALVDNNIVSATWVAPHFAAVKVIRIGPSSGFATESTVPDIDSNRFSPWPMALYEFIPREPSNPLNPVPTTPFRLMHLPAELRLNVFTELFKDAVLPVTRGSAARYSRSDRSLPFTLIVGADKSILRTSNEVYNEALPILNALTTLEVTEEKWRRMRVDPLGPFPAEFLSRIEELVILIGNFASVDRRRLPQLKRVHLTHTCYLKKYRPKWTLPELLRLIDKEGVTKPLKLAMRGARDWEAKQTESARLAASEGFALRMTVSLVVERESPMVVKFEMDCATNAVTSVGAFAGNPERAVENAELAELEWDAWTVGHTPLE